MFGIGVLVGLYVAGYSLNAPKLETFVFNLEGYRITPRSRIDEIETPKTTVRVNCIIHILRIV